MIVAIMRHKKIAISLNDPKSFFDNIEVDEITKKAIDNTTA